jgi:hypothetical protein
VGYMTNNCDLDGGHDVGERLVARGCLDLQDPVEVLLLDVDDDKRSARCGHGVSLEVDESGRSISTFGDRLDISVFVVASLVGGAGC